MNRTIHNIRRLFCFFSGEDDYIIRKCNAGIQLSFALIGLLVQVIFVLCWISAALFMSHIFDGARWISVLVGIIWAALVTNLYLLLLYTISPALLPVAGKKKKHSIKGSIKKADAVKKQSLLFSFSFLTRTGFICFLAIIVAQPFNVWLFTSRYEDADRFAATIQEILSTKPLSGITTALLCCIMLLPVYFKYRIRTISRENFKKDFDKGEGSASIRYLREQLGNPTDYQQLAEQILSTDINAIRTSDFYFQKTLLEYRMVLEEYRQFKEEYSGILTEHIVTCNQQCRRNLAHYLLKLEPVNPGLYAHLCEEMTAYLCEEKIEKYEYWTDPPFRTAYKSAYRKLAKEADLLQTLYPEQ